MNAGAKAKAKQLAVAAAAAEEEEEKKEATATTIHGPLVSCIPPRLPQRHARGIGGVAEIERRE